MPSSSAPLRVIGYCRVSTDGQALSGAGIDAQRAAIAAEAERRGWALDRWVVDTASGKRNPDERPELAPALAALDRGEADALVVAKVDRLSRSLVHFAAVMERARHRRWAVVALDLGVDMTSPAGEMLANVLASFAQYERRLIGQRTAEALSARRAQGVRLGRPVALPAAVRRRIAADHAAGASLSAIARALTAEAVPTAQGGAQWHASTVRAVLASLDADAATAQLRREAAAA